MVYGHGQWETKPLVRDNWCWENIGVWRLDDHHEESQGLGLGSFARKTKVPFIHRGHRVRSMPVKASISSWAELLGSFGRVGLRFKSSRHFERRDLERLASKRSGKYA